MTVDEAAHSSHQASDLRSTRLSQKTRRGLKARIGAGASGGGRSYGYRAIPGKPGQLAIDQGEAGTIVHIFERYAAGMTPRAIAAELNAEDIPAPRGGRWNASTINGSRARQNGIIANALYAGEMIWNRQRFETNRATGKRVSRPNPAEDWVRVQVPHLQIVDFELFLRANAIKARKGAVRAEHSRAPRHPLSGLLECSCGASFVVTGTHRFGCSRHRESGDCSNAATLSFAELEERVVATLEAQLDDPATIAARMRSHRAEQNRLAREAAAAYRADERRLTEVTAALERIVDRAIAGTAPEAMLARMDALEAERKELAAQFRDTRPAEPVRLHPGVAEHYRQAAADLRQRLAQPRTAAAVAELAATLCDLIEKIVIGPRQGKGPAPITVYGALTDMLTVSNSPPDTAGGHWLRGQDLNL
ncbi:MAG TPA: recombinase family protein [Devosia sp.]|nr:recombinase family protein [Devosia sp.]